MCQKACFFSLRTESYILLVLFRMKFQLLLISHLLVSVKLTLFHDFAQKLSQFVTLLLFLFKTLDKHITEK